MVGRGDVAPFPHVLKQGTRFDARSNMGILSKHPQRQMTQIWLGKRPQSVGGQPPSGQEEAGQAGAALSLRPLPLWVSISTCGPEGDFCRMEDVNHQLRTATQTWTLPETHCRKVGLRLWSRSLLPSHRLSALVFSRDLGLKTQPALNA